MSAISRRCSSVRTVLIIGRKRIAPATGILLAEDRGPGMGSTRC